MENTLIFLQSLLKTAAEIPFSKIPCTEDALCAHLQSAADLAAPQAGHGLWQRLTKLPEQNNAIYEFQLPGNIVLLLYADKADGSILCFGPIEARSRDALFQTAALVIEQLTGKGALERLVYAEVLSSPGSDMLNSILPEEDMVHIRQVEQRYEHSAALTEAVRQGNLSLALHIVKNYNPDIQTPVRNTNPLRNAQNYCIVLNTQLRHTLEESGIHPYQVDKLSNAIGLEIEDLKKTEQFPAFFTSVIRRYCRLVQEHAYPNLKPLTNLAVTYIKEHLADNLTVKDTAEALTVNANYLSALFHKDMGMTFIDFVNKERTDQAASLLRHTNLQIQQISAAVGFNNTSYFAKQFLRFQGVSPSLYRRRARS